VGELLGQSEADFTVLDSEASVEHLSRGTIRHVDLVLILAEPYYRSLETAARLGELARELGIPLVYGVANKVRTDREAELIAQFCRGRNLPLLAVLPFDEAVGQAELEGRPVFGVRPDSALAGAVAELASRVVELRPKVGVRHDVHR
jgi:CO dehydrogenase maturation factor